jgi:uncharacterized protein YutD
MYSEELFKRIVENYKKCYLHRNKVELEYFRCMGSFDDVIRNAALANNHGKRFHHQRRCQSGTLRKAHKKLKEIQEYIKTYKNFDDLHTLFVKELLPINGIGELYCYDTALRISAYLGYLPEKVYLHTGTREGAKKMGIIKDNKQKTIEIGCLPEPLRELEPHQIEDVLCIYKDLERISPCS